MTWQSILTNGLAILGGLVTLASVASAALPKESALAQWLAWFATMPIRHRPQVAPPKLDPPTGVVIGLLAFGALSLCQGCGGTFEEAKLAGVGARKASPVASSSTARCQSLSEREYWFTGTGLGLVAIGAATATLALPVKSQTTETILVVGGTSASVVGGGLTWFGTAAGVNYVREGCAR